MKKRNLFVLAIMMGITAGTIGATTIDSEAKTITVAQDASQVTYGTLTAEQKEIIATLFDADYYAYTNYDVVEALGTDYDVLFNHFCDCGIWEGRKGWPDFDPSAYASAYPQLREAYGTNILAYYLDYYNTGIAEGRYLTTVEKCEENGIQVQSLFGEWQFLDANIYQAASYLSSSSGSNGGGGAVVVNTEDGNTAVVVNAEDTETLSVLEKCKGLTYVETISYHNDDVVLFIVKVEPGYDVYKDLGEASMLGYINEDSSELILIDSTYAKDENGNLDRTKVVDSYDDCDIIIFTTNFGECDEDAVKSHINSAAEFSSETGEGLNSSGLGIVHNSEFLNSRFGDAVEYKATESTSAIGVIEGRADGYGESVSGRTVYSADSKADEDTEYTVGASISEGENGVVEFTIGAYNEENGYAISTGLTIQEN
ncbi:hypothetical protein [Pseudobutyrivibrio sp.]|uniref:hypothetical protein n=1 Tax=Pseudobutyrivibrio sp. TaxID=2014367 RepID=UPI00386A6E43